MEQWLKNRTRGTWSFAWLFALLFHQLLPVLLKRANFDRQVFVIITVYFGAITFFFTWMFLFLVGRPFLRGHALHPSLAFCRHVTC